jgi:hypothetical protein
MGANTTATGFSETFAVRVGVGYKKMNVILGVGFARLRWCWGAGLSGKWPFGCGIDIAGVPPERLMSALPIANRKAAYNSPGALSSVAGEPSYVWVLRLSLFRTCKGRTGYKRKDAPMAIWLPRQYFTLKTWLKSRLVSIASFYLVATFLFIIVLALVQGSIGAAILSIAPLVFVLMLTLADPKKEASEAKLSLTLANSEQAHRPRGMRNIGSLSTIT